MAASSLFRNRFSCRTFTADPVPHDVLEELLEAAIWAPNGGNVQPWRFVVVRDQQTKEALAAAALRQRFVADAPVVVVVCALPEVSARVYGQRGRDLYCLQDTAAATENLLLAATRLGLGTCWVGAFNERAAARALRLAADWRPVALVPVGVPATSPPRRTRLPLSEVVVWLE
jgi:nitroreductase